MDHDESLIEHPRTGASNVLKTATRLASTLFVGLSFVCAVDSAADDSLPNIVYILADDLGTGDVSSFNERSKISTPNIDRIAAAGMRFTDAHSGSGICTPTRYGILTGRYSWRTWLQRGVVWGYGRHLIEPERLTVASLLKRRGYNTACFGKWHLGMDFAIKDGNSMPEDRLVVNTREFIADVDWTGKIENGPLSLGFDTYFGISASLDMHPYIYIEDDHFVGQCTTMKDNTHRKTHSGPAHEDFEAVEVLPDIARRTVHYIEQQSDEKPFFVYMPLTSPHIPLVPAEEFQGLSELGTYGDFVIQTDHVVGQVLDALDRKGFTDNTLLIFTSDNGGAHYVGAPQMEQQGHYTNYIYRGYKADLFEGGHRVPFVVRWPGKVAPGSTSDETICLADLLATCAAVVGSKLQNNEGEDSFNILPAMLGEAQKPIREATVHHSGQGSFAIRQGKWKLALCPGSGGWSAPTNRAARETNLPETQLYNLDEDIAEKNNVHDQHPSVVQSLRGLLERYQSSGRSTALR